MWTTRTKKPSALRKKEYLIHESRYLNCRPLGRSEHCWVEPPTSCSDAVHTAHASAAADTYYSVAWYCRLMIHRSLSRRGERQRTAPNFPDNVTSSTLTYTFSSNNDARHWCVNSFTPKRDPRVPWWIPFYTLAYSWDTTRWIRFCLVKKVYSLDRRRRGTRARQRLILAPLINVS
jgi:hypothetical protein